MTSDEMDGYDGGIYTVTGPNKASLDTISTPAIATINGTSLVLTAPAGEETAPITFTKVP
jgi:hypothetical protein